MEEPPRRWRILYMPIWRNFKKIQTPKKPSVIWKQHARWTNFYFHRRSERHEWPNDTLLCISRCTQAQSTPRSSASAKSRWFTARKIPCFLEFFPSSLARTPSYDSSDSIWVVLRPSSTWPWSLCRTIPFRFKTPTKSTTSLRSSGGPRSLSPVTWRGFLLHV